MKDWSALLRPIRIASNHVQAILVDLEQDSQMHVNRSTDRAKVYKRFTVLKEYYEMMSDRDGHYVYYFLTSIEALPPAEREAGILQATAFLTASPEEAKTRIGQTVHALCENGTLSHANSHPLLLR